MPSTHWSPHISCSRERLLPGSVPLGGRRRARSGPVPPWRLQGAQLADARTWAERGRPCHRRGHGPFCPCPPGTLRPRWVSEGLRIRSHAKTYLLKAGGEGRWVLEEYPNGLRRAINPLRVRGARNAARSHGTWCLCSYLRYW